MGDSVCQWVVERISTPGQCGSPDKKLRIILKKGITTFGRAVGNTVQCPSILSSRRHCSIILKDDGSLFIIDYKSLNGTFLHHNRIITEREVALDDGDIIGLGVDPSMDDPDSDHPPETQYIFKITRIQLDKDELAARDDHTVVYVPDSPCNNTEQPSTSASESFFQKPEEKTLQVEAPPNACRNLLRANAIEVVKIDSSDEEEDIIKSTNETTNKPDARPSDLEKEMNTMSDNIITIDSDSELPSSTVCESKSAEQSAPLTVCVKHSQPVEDSASKPNVKNVKHIENDDISDEVLLNIKEVESAYNMDVADDISNIGQISDTPIENRCSISPPCVANISLSSDILEKSEPSKLDKLVDCVPEEEQLPENRNTEEDTNVDNMVDHNRESNLETDYMEIKKEETGPLNSFTIDDDIVLIEDDDDGELPCSQLFDVNCDAANVEEPCVDNDKNVDTECWLDIEDCNESDSDSDAEQWFQRLSQSHEPDSEEENEEEEKRDKPYADNIDDEANCADPSEKLVHTGDNHLSNQETFQEKNFVIDTNESQLSEPIFKKLPSGSKRKLSVSSDEDIENAHEEITMVVESCERKTEEICDVEENSISSNNKMKLGNSPQNSLKDFKMKEICKGFKSHRISDDSNESSSSSNKSKRLKKSYNLEKRSSSAHAPPTHKQYTSHRISEESDESNSSSTVSKRHAKSDQLKDKSLKSSHALLDSNTDDIYPDTSQDPSRKYKQKRKISTDTDSSRSSDTLSHNGDTQKPKVNVVSSPIDTNESSDDSEVWLKTCNMLLQHPFSAIYPKGQHKPVCEALSVYHSTNDEYIFDDIEDKIKPTKIRKSLNLQVSPDNKECLNIQTESESSKFEGSGILVGQQVQDTSSSKTLSSDKTDGNIKSADSVDKQTQDRPKLQSLSSPKAGSCEDSVDLLGTHAQNKECSKATSKTLTEVSKKINASYKKKTVPIIEAKSIKKRRTYTSGESETLSKKDDQTREGQHEQWLSSNKASKKTQHPKTTIELQKEYRKKRLKDLAMKDASENKHPEKAKTFSAKNKTKTTTQSRNDKFLQDLVSNDNAVVDKGDKLKKGDPLTSYKIPRRPSSTDDRVAATSSLTESEQPIVEPKLNKTPTSSTQCSSKTVSNKSNLKPIKHLSKSEPTTSSVLDQILNSAAGKSSEKTSKDNKCQFKTTVSGRENEEPDKVIYLSEDEYNKIFPTDISLKPKSLIKNSLMPKNNKKRLKFNFSNDEANTVYVSVRKFEIDDDSKLKPIIKSAREEGIRGAKQPFMQKQHTNYWEETIYSICNWNCSWFEERDRVKKDPPVFNGQTYHLTAEFTGYKDYRRGIYPLLMYELWGNVAKQYDLVDVKPHNRTNPLYNFEITGVMDKPVANSFFPNGRKKTLSYLICQVLLDKKQQDVWPRVGDFVVVSYVLKEVSRKEADGKIIRFKAGEKRAFGYVSHCPPPKPVSFHRDVSLRLRQKSPNANMVMDGLKILIRGDRGQPVDTDPKHDVKFKVLKNIKPELRVFDAVDRLPASPLCMQICQPKGNFLDVNTSISDQIALSLINHLNPSQKNAVTTIAKACKNDVNMIHLVHGPPGCGKSEVIVNIILQMWYDWTNTYKTTEGFHQILLCAPSNSAIDDLTNKLVSRMDSLGNPKFELIRVGLPQSTHESCAHLTLDHLTKMELKRLKGVKEDENQKRIEIQCLEARKHQLSQKLDSLIIRQNTMATLPNVDKKKETDMIKEIKDVEKKLAQTKAKINYFESGKQPDGKEMASKWKEIQLELLQKANIVATTLSSCYNGIMSEAHNKRYIKFDCCIVDEATQCIEPDSLIPLMLGVKKLVLVGDPKQLPATVITSTAKTHGLERSLFARHYDWWKKQQRDMNTPENPCHFLNMQYRMHPEIAQWPSEHFYENRLLSLESLRDRSNACPLMPYIVLSHNHPQNPQEECNTEEGRLVSCLVRGIASHQQCQGLTIGIITPYNRQKEELKRRINLREFPNLEIGTVDSYQGRERDVVIFSCVRTEGVGFLGGQERLNVALTRAKHSLIVVGNFTSLKRDQTWNSLLNNAKSRHLFKPVVNNHTVCSLIFKPGF